MADISYNTMRFLADQFNAYLRQALLVDKKGLDLTDCSQLDNFILEGQEPQGTQRRFMFKIDNKIYTFDGQALAEYPGTLSLDNVLQDGNTAAQVEAVKNNTALAGKKIFPIIALSTSNDTAPTVKLSAAASFVTDVLDREILDTGMPCYDDDFNTCEVKLLGCEADIQANGNASAQVLVKLGHDGTETDWLPLEQAKGQLLDHYRFKINYHVDEIKEGNSVKVNSYTIHYSPDLNRKVYGDVAYLYSIIRNFTVPLKHCALVVRHSKLDGATIDAHLIFQKTRYTTTVTLGTGNDSSQTFELSDDFFTSTLKVFIDGVADDDFEFNTANRHVLVKAPSGSLITASYTRTREVEQWLPMSASSPQPAGNDIFTTLFSLPNADTSPSFTYSAVRLTLTRLRTTDTITKKATGSEQRLTLSHKVDSCSCDATDWNFDDLEQILTFTAPAGQTVTISYTWHGSMPIIYGWSAAWSA